MILSFPYLSSTIDKMLSFLSSALDILLKHAMVFDNGGVVC